MDAIDKTSLVLEGGGIRGFFSAGVLDGFMKAGISTPIIYGVSAGAANAASYVSGQYHRNRKVVEGHVGKWQYLSKRNMLLHGSMFGYDYVFKTVPERYVPFDWEAFNESPDELMTGCMNIETGLTEWFSKSQMAGSFDIIRASCSIPFMSHIVNISEDNKNYKLLDGGFTCPIPIQKSINDGNDFHIVVLTHNEGYIKQPTPPFAVNAAKLRYPKHPAIAEAFRIRAKVYMEQLALCEELERQGKALIIRPELPMKVGRTTKNIPDILGLYDEGEQLGFRVAKANAFTPNSHGNQRSFTNERFADEL